jgi:hypothetical protein
MPSAHLISGCLAGEEQLLVESYFAAAGSLPANYWIGIFRSGSTDPFKYVSGQLVSNVVGNANPYAHWWAAGSAPCPLLFQRLCNMLMCAARGAIEPC